MVFRRMLVIVLGLMCVLGLIQVGAMASEMEGSIVPIVNPMYQELYEAGDFALAEQDAHAPEAEGEVSEKAPDPMENTYVSKEEAVHLLLNDMINRRENSTLYIADASGLQDVILKEILQAAMTHNGNPEAGDYLLYHFVSMGGSYTSFHKDGKYHYTFELELTYLTDRSEEKEVDSEIEKLIDREDLEDKTDYEKIRGIYDYLCSNVSCVSAGAVDAYKSTAYGAAVLGAASSDGFAAFMYRAALTLGVDCRIIPGVDNLGSVSWNIVRLGDVYYNLDASMDASKASWQYFLRSNPNFPNHYRSLEYCTADFHTRFPIAEKDYTDGEAGTPEFYYVAGTCGIKAYWAIDRTGTLTITGTGAIDNYSSETPWEFWKNDITNLVIDEGITLIGVSCFEDMDNLVSASLPSTLKSIRFSAFYSSGLESIVIPDSVTSIENSAFYDCFSLKEVKLSNSLKVIPSSCFYGCSSLERIVIPESVVVLDSCFGECRSLKEVVLGSNVERITGRCFGGCDSLKEIDFPASLQSIGSLFYECKQHITMYFHGDAPELTSYCFYGLNATIHYPMHNDTWTEEYRTLNYIHSVTWVPYCDHDYSKTVIAPSCVQDGAIVYTCTMCGETESRFNGYATGLHLFSDDADTTCDTCGFERPIRESRPVVHMFRMYDPNSGEHFYTGSEEERDNLISAGWNYEGVGFTFPLTTGDPVHRLYDPVYGEHLYTMDEAEMNALLETGWNYEGVAFNSAFEDEVPQYRLHNPNANRGAYHFTSSIEERDFLISVGWEYQGIGWYSCWK